MKEEKNEILKDLIRDLSDPDESVRRIAVEEIGDLRNEEAAGPLVELLGTEQNVGVLEAAGDALPKLAGKGTVKLLLPLLYSQEAKVRNLVCEILINIGNDSLEHLVEQLGNPDKDVRKFIIDVMGEIGSREVVRPLMDSVDDHDINAACSAIESLGKIGDPRAVPALIKAVRDGNPDKGFYAVAALGKIKDESAAEFLRDIVQEEMPLLKYAAVSSMGEIGSRSTVNDLKKFMCSDDPVMKRTALKALGKTGAQYIEEAFSGKMESCAEKFVMECLDEDDQELRKYALTAAGYISSRQIAAVIAGSLLKHEDGRPFALQSLVRIGRKDMNSIMQLLEREELKELCCSVLGDVQNAAAVPALTEKASDPDENVRKSALLALGKIGGDEAVKALAQRTSDDNAEVRETIAMALGWTGSKAAVPVLAGLLRDGSRAVAENAAHALVMINGEEVRKLFIANARDKDPLIREAAMISLGSISPDENIKNILTNGLRDEAANVRKAAASALGGVSSREFMDDLTLLKHLSPLMEDNDKDVKKAAIRSLGRISNGRVAEALVDVLARASQNGNNWVKYEIIRVLKKYPTERAEDVLIRQLIEGDTLLQAAACDSLGNVGGEKAKTALRGLISTAGGDIREAAEKALEGIDKRAK